MSASENDQLQQENATTALDRLLAAIEASNSTDEEKTAAKSKVAGFLNGAVTTVTEGGARALVERFKS